MTVLAPAAVPWSVWTNAFMPNAKLSSRLFQQRRYIAFAVGKAVRKRKIVVQLNAFYFDTATLVPFRQLPQEICGWYWTEI